MYKQYASSFTVYLLVLVTGVIMIIALIFQANGRDKRRIDSNRSYAAAVQLAAALHVATTRREVWYRYTRVSSTEVSSITDHHSRRRFVYSTVDKA